VSSDVAETPPTSVLIVEDEAAVAQDLREALVGFGYDVVGSAASADEALWMVKLHLPDVILIDVVIEGTRDGIALARLLREDFNISIVFTTSHADQQTLSRAGAVKPNGYLVKPYREQDVDAAIKIAIANYSQQQRKIDLHSLSAEQRQAACGLPLSAVEKIDRFLDCHYSEDLSIDRLAEIVEVQVSTFSKRFKKATGLSPYRYLVRKRMEEAKSALRHTDRPIIEVAAECGYSNQAHFSTSFKKEVGMTPKQYRLA